MQAEAAITRPPLVPGGVLSQALDLFPCASAVTADKQARLVHTRVECIRLRRVTRHDLPDAVELKAALFSVARTCLDLRPVGTEVVADTNGGAINEMRGAREQSTTITVTLGA